MGKRLDRLIAGVFTSYQQQPTSFAEVSDQANRDLGTTFWEGKSEQQLNNDDESVGGKGEDKPFSGEGTTGLDVPLVLFDFVETEML